MSLRHIVTVSMVLALTAGCYRGYKSADKLERDDRGPRACYDACQKLGMHMSAFVLVEHASSGCVCAPGAAPPLTGAAAGTAASWVVLEAERQAREQQAQAAQQQQMQMPR